MSRNHCNKEYFTQLQSFAVDIVESTTCVTYPLSPGTFYSETHCCRRRRWVHDVRHASTFKSIIFLCYKLLPSTSLSPRCVSRIHCHKEHLPRVQTIAVDVVESTMCFTHPLPQRTFYSVIKSCRRRRWVHDVCLASTVTRNILLSYKLLSSTSFLSMRCVTHTLLQGTTYPVRNCCRERHLVHDLCHASTLKRIILLRYKVLPSTFLCPWCESRIHFLKEQLTEL